MPRPERGERFLATVLFTDIVGSTELAKRLGDRAWRDLLAEFYRTVRTHLRRTGGRELDTAGDGLLAAFDAPGPAIDCALAVRRDVADLGIQVRSGLHVGEVNRLGPKLGGIAVHIGARVAALAEPDEVLVTRTVRDMASGSSIVFEDRGEHSLKGVGEEWHLYAVATVGDEAGDRQAAAPMRRRARPFWARHRLPTAAAGALLIAAAAVGGYLFVSSPPGLESVDANTVGVIDAARAATIGQIPVGAQPSALAFGEGSLWVANSGDASVTRLDPEGMTRVDTIEVGRDPAGIAIGFGAVWVANAGAGTVSQINADANTVVREIDVGNGPVDVAIGGDSVWVVTSIDGTLVRIAADSGEPVSTIHVGPSASAVGADERSVWVLNLDAGAVTRFDVSSGTPVGSTNVGSGPVDVAIGHGAVWVANSRDGTVSRIDSESGRGVGTIVVPGQPTGIAVSEDAVWVANSIDGSVSRIDPESEDVRTVRVGASPERLVATADGRIWFSARASLASHRGGTLRVLLPQLPLSLDPAIAYDTEAWMAMAAAYDGLVGYRRQGGTGGTALVADLAESLPRPGDGGTTYSFRVREGIRYSDGEPVRAEDFRHAIERGFEVPGTDEAAAAVFYGGLVGAEACIAAIGTEAGCDLSDGIVADDATRSVTFRLTQPDPEFLYKLALPFAFVVPGDTPSEAAATPPAATGPYMIADATETEIRLVRNPEFQVWSPEARPEGFPDEMVWTIGGDDDEAIDQIIAGEADLFSRPPPSRLEELATRFTSQIHFQPSGTLYAFLDTARPPFDDVRVRQAINLAVDRERVVELIGGSLQASVTCQIIQPNFHGYRRVCPHTVDAGPAGLWTAPDIPRALALVEEAEAAGTPVEIWAPDADPLPLVADYLATVMRELGFEASVTPLTFDEFFSGVDSDDRGPVAAPLVWFPDYPAASTFIQSNFACGSPINFAQFCNPALDERMQEAVDLQATDPGRAASIWAELDAAITEAAPWVPLATFNNTYFVSERVGNVQLHSQWGVLLDQIWVE